ncbi:hypothetical protein L1S32_07220 [Methanogenium sp. S4BF]|uniref:hypothetical protein n=1 Tax=Methanogenium sp. S4BF TaxID=1789226 RepID=UPI002417DB39|nr:hypothetical protein [Methanogenium sp. S4BF]WFN33642.1 hypothetical protein L1S32_07220 [Methanogenium sp. S4BF]
MGDSKDVMNSYVTRDLRKMFSPGEGWNIDREPECGGASFAYVVSRKRFGKSAYYPVDVCMEAAVSAEKAGMIQQQCDKARAAGVALEPMLLFVPTGADVTAVPADIMIKYLKVLKVEDGQVIWWKKVLPAE